MSLLADLCRRLRREWPREGDAVLDPLPPEIGDETLSGDPVGYRTPTTGWAPSPAERDQYRPEAISPHLFAPDPAPGSMSFSDGPEPKRWPLGGES